LGRGKDPGSEIRKKNHPGSRIRIPDHWGKRHRIPDRDRQQWLILPGTSFSDLDKRIEKRTKEFQNPA
jgi:hypothetical protein